MEELLKKVEKLELLFYHIKNSTLNEKIFLKDCPKPWKIEKPNGLNIFENAITKNKRDQLWNFFHPKDGNTESDVPLENEFPWIQRFKRFPSAHYNGWHSGKFRGLEEMKLFETTYPIFYETVIEAHEFIKTQNITNIPNLENFIPESISVMRHKPYWGLGRHYDNSQDENSGIVMLITLSNDDKVPRTFNFVDAPNGKQFPVKTFDSQVIIFGGECYDLWQHESIRNPKQTGEAISLTVRLADVCGNNVKLNKDNNYKPGAPAAMKIAHKRLLKKMLI